MASIFQTFPLLGRAAPRLSREFFTCSAGCLRKPQAARSSILKSIRLGLLPKAFRPQLRPITTANARSAIPEGVASLRLLSNTIGGVKKTKTFPDVSDKAVAYWLLGSAASVFGIVVFGGLTRLTESGLSITEWRPVTGSMPPFSEADWESEFTKYRSSPEFIRLNPRMALSEFKQIYWMEWTHRLWGRVVGMSFLLPTVYFIARRRVSARMALNLTGVCGLIGFQGFVGWWMVKSGLKDDLFSPGSHPRVSQYRLAVHLGTAFACYTAMLWNALSILREHRLLKAPSVNPSASHSLLQTLSSPSLKTFRRSTFGLACLVFTTAMSGALVAGLDAGLIYNEFPYMGLGLTPPRTELFDPFYSRDKANHSDLWWRNFLENPSLVQLDHRILATTTFCAVHTLWAYSRYLPTVRRILPLGARKGMSGVVHLVWLQVTLGIFTLLYLVPTPLAATHQAGSLALLTGVVVLGSRVWVPRRTARLVADAAARASRSKIAGYASIGRSVGHGRANPLDALKVGKI